MGVRMFGPYPFASTGAIVGLGEDAGYALETQNRPFFPGPPDVGLLVHELAHQWFGNSVTPASWQDMWLNEGFATYAEWLWSEDHGDATVRELFDEAYEDGANWAFPPGRPPGAADLSEPPVYGRGAMVVHRIREEMGDDDAFFGLVRGWLKAHRHGNASTDDFTAYVERESGLDLTELWDTWLNGGSRPRVADRLPFRAGYFTLTPVQAASTAASSALSAPNRSVAAFSVAVRAPA